MYVDVSPTFMSMHHMLDAYRGHKKVVDPPGLEWLTVVNHLVGAGHQITVW